MKGGGDWEEYCPACGLPFGGGYGEENPYEWLKNALGYETGKGKHRVFELGHYSYNGYMDIYDIYNSSNSNTNSNTNNNNGNNNDSEFKILDFYDNFEYAYDYSGIALHADCVKAIETALGRKITYKDAIIFKKNKPSFDDLLGNSNEQFFEWKRILRRRNIPKWIFESPVENEQSRKRIIQYIPAEVWEASVPRARAIHTLTEKIPGLVPNIAFHVTPYVTGLEAHQYMPERFKGAPKRRTRRETKTRKARKTRQQMRR